MEGNGQQPPDLVELAIVSIIEGQIGDARSWLVKPPRPITPMARRFHRITDVQVSTAPTAEEVAAEIRSELDRAVFVAHNAHVDLGVLTRTLPGFTPVEVVDTLKLARRLLPGQMSYKLGHLAETLSLTAGLGADLQPHRATYDALVCARLLARLASPPAQTALTFAALLGKEPADDPAETLF
ncbi:exonuclease domain-containing protein [Streptosporangium sp. NPDC000509]|uniref:3'-5' exonuclease n=1 Tax=Streptosporangium sp. NPDC000509 TaxID=3366186 RepID=UPI00368ED453